MIGYNKLTLGLLKDTEKYALNKKDNEAISIIEELKLNEIIQVDFPEDQYVKEQTNKDKIVLHHTVSGDNVEGDIDWWKQTPERIATCVIIDRTGTIYQCFSSMYWAHHLGLKTSNNTALNKSSIGIEIDSWGGLVKEKGLWYPAQWSSALNKYIANKKVRPIQNVVEYKSGFMGMYGYEKYTDQQILSVKKLILYFSKKYNIPVDYNEDMWNLSNNAISGKSGVWTHVSYRGDGKSDCHPQKELVDMLKSLKS